MKAATSTNYRFFFSLRKAERLPVYFKTVLRSFSRCLLLASSLSPLRGSGSDAAPTQDGDDSLATPTGRALLEEALREGCKKWEAGEDDLHLAKYLAIVSSSAESEDENDQAQRSSQALPAHATSKDSVVGALFDYFGSDRGSFLNNYGVIYDELFFGGIKGAKKSKNDPNVNYLHRCAVRKVLEIGIGITDLEVSRAAADRGASLRAAGAPHVLQTGRMHAGADRFRTRTPAPGLHTWRAFFPNAEIHGVDLEPAAMVFGKERITTFTLNTLNRTEVAAFVARQRNNDISSTFYDVILDDGLHDNLANRALLRDLWPALHPKHGVYVIEDLRLRWRKKELLEALFSGRAVAKSKSSAVSSRSNAELELYARDNVADWPVRLHRDEDFQRRVLRAIAGTDEKGNNERGEQEGQVEKNEDVEGGDDVLAPLSVLSLHKARLQRGGRAGAEHEQPRQLGAIENFFRPDSDLALPLENAFYFFENRRRSFLHAHVLGALQGLSWRNSTARIKKAVHNAENAVRLLERMDARWCCQADGAGQGDGRRVVAGMGRGKTDDDGDVGNLRRYCWTNSPDSFDFQGGLSFHYMVNYCVPVMLNATSFVA